MTDRPVVVQTDVQGYSLHVRRHVGDQHILSAETRLILIGSSLGTSSCRHEHLNRKERTRP